MIKRLSVSKLNDKISFESFFNPDINIFTGKNGSGKTTILKLMWYLNGGYIINLVNEIMFEEIELETSNLTISAKRLQHKKDRGTSYEFKLSNNNENDRERKDDITITLNERNLTEYEMRSNYDLQNSKFRDASIPSLFFPTFRRIEGGFGMEGRRKSGGYYMSERNSVKEVWNSLSERLSNYNQKFVASISTDDIVNLVTSQFAKITEEFNSLQKEQSENIIKQIRYRQVENDSTLLSSIQEEIEKMESKRKEYFSPFTTLSEIISLIFRHKGIKLNSLTIGDIGEAISSEKLSAGEKQMLSFICYNTFTKNSVIYIDEPELSLHPDWQRILIPTLVKQDNSNQFFIATHSPFIYSKYADKEMMVDFDKGE